MSALLKPEEAAPVVELDADDLDAEIDEPEGRLVESVEQVLPVETVRAMGADIVIAVDLISCGSSFRMHSRVNVGIMLQSALALLRTVSIREQLGADLVIEPEIAHLRPDQINKRDEFIMLGKHAAVSQIEKIKALIRS